MLNERVFAFYRLVAGMLPTCDLALSAFDLDGRKITFSVFILADVLYVFYALLHPF